MVVDTCGHHMEMELKYVYYLRIIDVCSCSLHRKFHEQIVNN